MVNFCHAESTIKRNNKQSQLANAAARIVFFLMDETFTFVEIFSVLSSFLLYFILEGGRARSGNVAGCRCTCSEVMLKKQHESITGRIFFVRGLNGAYG